jgi:hypothetical protein
MGQQALAVLGGRRILTNTEDDLVADGKGSRIELSRGFSCPSTRV